MDVKFLVEADPKTVEPMTKELARLGVLLFGLSEEKQVELRRTSGSLVCIACGFSEALERVRTTAGILHVWDISEIRARAC